ncbi:MAG: type II toxin-antitoxin system HicB family antitoxin [cyanobacterium endosymbiont of Rhopalodia yunnanensis]
MQTRILAIDFDKTTDLAIYKIKEDNKFYWEKFQILKEFDGSQKLVERCIDGLRENLSGWIVLRLRSQLEIKIIDRIDLNTIH